jgi:hypothetical protein
MLGDDALKPLLNHRREECGSVLERVRRAEAGAVELVFLEEPPSLGSCST